MYKKFIISKEYNKKIITLSLFSNAVKSLTADIVKSGRSAYSRYTPSVGADRYDVVDNKAFVGNKVPNDMGIYSYEEQDVSMFSIERAGLQVAYLFRGNGRDAGKYTLEVLGVDTDGLTGKDRKTLVLRVEDFGEVLSINLFNEGEQVAKIVCLPFGEDVGSMYTAYTLYYNDEVLNKSLLFEVVCIMECLLKNKALYVIKDDTKCISYSYIRDNFGSEELYNVINFVATVRSEIISNRNVRLLKLRKQWIHLKNKVSNK